MIVIERVLLLVRNVLHIPPDPAEEKVLSNIIILISSHVEDGG